MRGDIEKVDGEAIRRLRAQKGWSQDDLARKTGYGKRLIQKMEAGGTAKLATIKEFAEALGVDTRDLLAEDVPTSAQKEKSPYLLIKFEITIRSEVFDKSIDALTFVDILKRCLPARDEISIEAVQEGSIILILRMSERDILTLVFAVRGGWLHVVAQEQVINDLKRVANVDIYVRAIDGSWMYSVGRKRFSQFKEFVQKLVPSSIKQRLGRYYSDAYVRTLMNVDTCFGKIAGVTLPADAAFPHPELRGITIRGKTWTIAAESMPEHSEDGSGLSVE